MNSAVTKSEPTTTTTTTDQQQQRLSPRQQQVSSTTHHPSNIHHYRHHHHHHSHHQNNNNNSNNICSVSTNTTTTTTTTTPGRGRSASLPFSNNFPKSTYPKYPHIPHLSDDPNEKKHYGMIAEGTGIIPLYQLIRHVLENPEDRTRISLVYKSRSVNDILLRQELENLELSHPSQFDIYYTVIEDPQESTLWEEGIGHITKDMLQLRLPPPQMNDQIKIFVCGDHEFMEEICGDKNADKSQGELRGLLSGLGYSKEQVHKF